MATWSDRELSTLPHPPSSSEGPIASPLPAGSSFCGVPVRFGSGPSVCGIDLALPAGQERNCPLNVLAESDPVEDSDASPQPICARARATRRLPATNQVEPT